MIIKITVSRLILMFSSVFDINWKQLCLMSLAQLILRVTAALSGHAIGSHPLLPLLCLVKPDFFLCSETDVQDCNFAYLSLAS